MRQVRQQECAKRRRTPSRGVAAMLGHDVTEEDEQLRAKSNRTFARLAALPLDVAAPSSREERIQAAQGAQDWDLVASLAAERARHSGDPAVEIRGRRTAPEAWSSRGPFL